jgi:hypothetical protein
MQVAWRFRLNFKKRFVETANRSPAILPARQIEMKSS